MLAQKKIPDGQKEEISQVRSFHSLKKSKSSGENELVSFFFFSFVLVVIIWLYAYANKTVLVFLKDNLIYFQVGFSFTLLVCSLLLET